ncbi:class I SAM-dependent DNA methyltransferase [Rhodococcus sp. (in: high G+C Gram-positive bacteria)]|uniref:class I SAM-dependent DNA methyltransferase n=1 Tax=Rhodococcus sp. TaxID=1831 RepID=UPI003B8A8480
MNRMPDDYFADMYSQAPDPWGFDERWYEERKRALTAAVLPRRRFRSAFEPGCSIGNLTEVLATRCDHVLATDIVDDVLERARARLDGADVTFRRWALGDPWPTGSFDLVVLSEVAYYLSPQALDRTLDDLGEHLATDGVILAVHWRHPVADYPQTGDAVHAALAARTGLVRTARYADPDVLIETFEPGPETASVAAREGLLG